MSLSAWLNRMMKELNRVDKTSLLHITRFKVYVWVTFITFRFTLSVKFLSKFSSILVEFKCFAASEAFFCRVVGSRSSSCK